MESKTEKKHGCLFIGSIMLLTIVISVGATIWIFTQYIFPKRFDPVELSATEQENLDRKLRVFEGFETGSAPAQDEEDTAPEKYSEEGADRRIKLTERELNGMLASNTDLAERLVIDLSENLASGKLLVPLDPDFPIMGGKTLKITAGMELAFRNDKPIVVLKGVSIMGVPLPNAWLGNMKNVDLVREFGGSEGFWKSFADGVENIEVNEGRLVIQLRE